MGVTGLLPHLKEIQEPCSLEKYRGKTLAIDAYGWLHRGLISCAQELCQNVPTRKYINCVIKKVEMLQYFGVEPYLVFDGSYLPTKAETARERKVKRDEARVNADNYIKLGNKKAAWKEFMKAAGVTPEMAKSVMVELDLRKIKYVVAPYEADPQMVYLEKIGLVDGILSEDSDLLIFGCTRLITKLKDTAQCIEINRENFDKVRLIPNLAQYTPEQLRMVAMLSGCDYTKGVAGIGVKTAFTLVKKYGNLERVLMAIRAEGKKIDDDFVDEAAKANLAFQFQKVFNPTAKELRTLNEYPADIEIDLEVAEICCGQTLQPELHVGICTGELHPNTHETLFAREQSIATLKSKSVNFGTKTAVVATRSQSDKGIDSFFKKETKEKKEVKLNFGSAVKTIEVTSTTSLSMAKRPVEKTTKLSPTSKKLKKYMTSQKGDLISKFFVPMKPNSSTSTDLSFGEESSFNTSVEESMVPLPDKSKDFNSSILDDSDIPDSLPVQEVLKGEIKANLTDCDSDDDIEESPVKPKLSAFALNLRERFLMNEGVKNSINLKPQQREPIKEVISVKQHIEHQEEKENVPEVPDKIKVPRPKHVDLRQFAFTRS